MLCTMQLRREKGANRQFKVIIDIYDCRCVTPNYIINSVVFFYIFKICVERFVKIVMIVLITCCDDTLCSCSGFHVRILRQSKSNLENELES